MARSILDQAHALQLQSMGDLGRIRDLDRTLAGTLMAEFSRVQLIVQEDVGKSLVALRSDLLASCSAFIADVARVMDIPPADPRSALLEASLERFRRQASLKFDLPLAKMDVAAVDITAFMNARLQELSSRTELPDLIEEAARLMGRHNNRVWELVQDPDLGLSDVYSRVLVGLLAQQPIEADLFPGILEGLAGNLGLSPARTVNPPHSRQEGMMRWWATALRQAAYDPSNTGQGSASSTTPLGLNLDYSMEFRSPRVGDIPPALTSSLLLVPLAEGGKARNIVSPRFQGGSASALILYDEETVSPELGPQPPMRISLCAPSQDHWTIVLDTVFPSTIEEYRRLWEQATSKPTKTGALPSSSSGNGAGRAEAAPSRERTLRMARSILDQAHALQLQSMGDLGHIRDLDRTLAGTLMAEFSCVQLIVQEDVGKSLVALRSDLLASCSAFIADVARVMDIPLADPRSALLEASLERFRRQASLKFDLPLAKMDAAAVDITAFMNARLQELSSRTELPDLIEEAARLMGRHNNRVWELVQDPDLGLSDVYSRVLVGLLAQQPIEADLFPGILEGLAENLGLSPARTVNPPHSRQEGMMRWWATALRQAAYDPSDTGQGSASSTTPLGLNLDYSMEFRSPRVGDIPPALTSSLLLVPLAEGGKARNIVSPRFQGGSASALILYDEETVSPELGPQPPMRISLCAPSQDHWTIVLDTVLCSLQP